MKDALLRIPGLERQSWIKFPYNTWALLKKSGYTSSEMLVVVFFYHKLCHNPLPDSTVVFATSQEIMSYSGITRSVYYGAIEKMKGKGLLKAAPNTYDLKV